MKLASSFLGQWNEDSSGSETVDSSFVLSAANQRGSWLNSNPQKPLQSQRKATSPLRCWVLREQRQGVPR